MLKKVKKVYIQNSGAIKMDDENISYNFGDKNVAYLQIKGIDSKVFTEVKTKSPGGTVKTITCTTVDNNKYCDKEVLVPTDEVGQYSIQIIQTYQGQVNVSDMFTYKVNPGIEQEVSK